MTGQPETLACGQNNQGYGTITVMPSTTTTLERKPGPPAFTASIGNLHGPRRAMGRIAPAGARLQATGLVDGKRSNVRLGAHGRIPSIPLERPVTGLIYTRARANTRAIQPVLVYDGPPSAGHPIAATTAAGATRARGGEADFTWRPTTPGLHTIHVLMLGANRAADSHETMKVRVLARLARPL